MSIYADSSFLAGLYLDVDAHSHKARMYMVKHPVALLFTPFNRIELRSALRQRGARGECPAMVVKEALRQIDLDMKEGFLVHAPVELGAVIRKADELSDRHPLNRTLDLIHVASAMVLGSKTFLTFDERQAVLAKAGGLKVQH